MVFQRKSGGKGKQQTPAKSRKSFPGGNNLNEMDMDFDDSNDNQMMKKTPKGKQQVQNDKRVSFQIPGKNTPNKGTPKGGPLANKKQATPGKVGNLKAFGGMAATKRNGKAKKPSSDDDDDDDDEDDEDDDEEGADLDMMFAGDSEDDDDDDDDDDDEDDDEDEEEKAPKKGNKTNLFVPKGKGAQDDDDDDDDEDDDEDDDDDDEDDDDEEEEELPKGKLNQSKTVQKKDSTPVQNKSANKQAPVKKEAASPQKKEINPIVKNFVQLDTQRRRERDARTLYVGNLPKDINAAELKALSSDIMAVNLPSHQKHKRSVFAFLEFASESKAVENIELLKKKKLRGEPLTLDFAGEKSQKRKMTELPSKDFNLKKLYVADVPAEGTMDQVAQLFPKSIQISLAVRPTFKSATILFATETDAAEAIAAAKSAKICSKPVTVVYSIQRDAANKKRKRAGKRHTQSGAKKMKQAKQGSDDDDDDEGDSDE